MARLRVSNHCLEIEKGRHITRGKSIKIPPDKRFCNMCKFNLVEDEFHFICICNKYDTLRNSFFDALSSFVPDFTNMNLKDKYYFLMTTNEMEILKLFSFFIHDCFEIRKGI